MASAKLIKSLEKKGFFLELPEYENSEEEIIEILKENNPRLLLSLPALLIEGINYKKICSKLNFKQKKEFNKAILISEKIYKNKNIKNNLSKLIKENNIKTKISRGEFQDYYNAFKEIQLSIEENKQKRIEKQSKLRLNLNLNKDLKILFSPGKIRIMDKIYNHEKLTNTELKYYYKAISSINKAVLNPIMHDYLRTIEITKKEKETNQY